MNSIDLSLCIECREYEFYALILCLPWVPVTPSVNYSRAKFPRNQGVLMGWINWLVALNFFENKNR